MGQILVEWGATTRLELASALAEQWSYAGSTPLRRPGEPRPEELEAVLTEAQAEYHAAWLHSGQRVTVEGDGTPLAARILRVSPNWGLLEAEELATGRRIGLQSDGNSFDFLHGLIRRKL